MEGRRGAPTLNVHAASNSNCRSVGFQEALNAADTRHLVASRAGLGGGISRRNSNSDTAGAGTGPPSPSPLSEASSIDTYFPFNVTYLLP